MVGRAYYDTFRGIKDTVWHKINSWENQFLFPTSKEVLLKAVIQSIPTYHMSVFRLPKRLCKEISSIMTRFWWGYNNNEKKIQWASWEKMGCAKMVGGHGFRKLESFNTTLLAKQCWRLVTKPDSIAAMVLKAKYYKNSDVLSSKLGY
ncbi:uncharacterized mitochondrial protein AtMg00310-like [Juglans regia]|uniref:Uncharacterized mitochondrial protein AtMg00310-like n=1 Tax=Juglans regia TaxID=51240 RepID=A0A6P9F8Z8_JUGRE|nr:uncharacterized mitochondrial protein AtMg00310-like [Juglans regia]